MARRIVALVWLAAVPSCAAFCLPALAPHRACTPALSMSANAGAKTGSWAVGGEEGGKRKGLGMAKQFWVTDSPGKLGDLHLEDGWLPAPTEGEVTVKVPPSPSLGHRCTS